MNASEKRNWQSRESAYVIANGHRTDLSADQRADLIATACDLLTGRNSLGARMANARMDVMKALAALKA